MAPKTVGEVVVNGAGGLVKNYPHVPGIDCAGTVSTSGNAAFKPGDRVIMTGWRFGEQQWGGLAQLASLKGDWLVPLPAALSTRQAMAIGTAGLTAMLAVMALEDHGLTPASGEVLVTGAAGGVGSAAIAILDRRGYKTVASSGRPEARASSSMVTSAAAPERPDRSEKITKEGITNFSFFRFLVSF